MKTSSDARDRIVREAVRLFAERGYDRTSVPDIQEAAGLSPGSGALYKHFPSKKALLATAVERFIEAAHESHEELARNKAPDQGARWIVENMLEKLSAHREVLRILWRDLAQFPDLQAATRSEVMQATYRGVAAWLKQRQELGDLRPHDSEAMATIIVGSIAMFRVFEATWGERAIKISDERFISAWLELVARGLGNQR